MYYVTSNRVRFDRNLILSSNPLACAWPFGCKLTSSVLRLSGLFTAKYSRSFLFMIKIVFNPRIHVIEIINS